MKLSEKNAHDLFDILVDNIACDESPESREHFVWAFTTAVPESWMLMDDRYRVFILERVTDRRALGFRVRPSDTTVQTSAVLDKVYGTAAKLDGLLYPDVSETI